MGQSLNYLMESASQTAGPFVHIGLARWEAGFDICSQELGRDIAGPDAAGERISVEGVVFNGTGAPAKDALLGVWHADTAGPHRNAPRGETLLARKVKPGLYRFDIRLHGDGETVFLDI